MRVFLTALAWWFAGPDPRLAYALTNAVAVLILERIPVSEPPNAERISKILEISPARGRLVAALVAGKSIKEYAFEAGISIHTARTHLKKVFLALGVKSQAGLIRIVLTRLRSTAIGL